MKSTNVRFAALAALLVSSASAEMILASGQTTGVNSLFSVSVDPGLNRVIVEVDNTLMGPGGVTGTLMSFGFNLPDSIAGSGTLLEQDWTTLLAGHTEPGDWALAQPYALSGSAGIFVQDFGAFGGSNENGGNPNRGVLFGEKARFVFGFADFTGVDGFFGEGGLSARWQQVNLDPGSDKGLGGEPPDFTPVPEPATYGLIGSTVLFAAGLLRRRRSSAVPVPTAA